MWRPDTGPPSRYAPNGHARLNAEPQVEGILVEGEKKVEEKEVGFSPPFWKFLLACSFVLGLTATHFFLENAIGAAVYSGMPRPFLVGLLLLGAFQVVVPAFFERLGLLVSHVLVLAGVFGLMAWSLFHKPYDIAIFNSFFTKTMLASGALALAILFSYGLIRLKPKEKRSAKRALQILQKKVAAPKAAAAGVRPPP
jgi:hypothetical protein